jgi:hypothetical protein
MFCAEAREVVREAVVVGEVPQARVQEAGVPQGQYPLLRNMAKRAVIYEEDAAQSVRSDAGRECRQRKSSSSSLSSSLVIIMMRNYRNLCVL